MKYALRALVFFARSIGGLVVLAGLMLVGLNVGMDTTHVYIIVTDGIKERTSEILLPAENDSDLSDYYTADFLAQDQDTLASPYAQDQITSFDYDLEIKSLWCFPGSRTATADVILSVTGITGSRVTGQIDASGNAVTETVADWDRVRLTVTCVKEGSEWLIDQIEQTEVLEPRATPTDEPFVTPRPTATPMPEPELTEVPFGSATREATASPAPAARTGKVTASESLNVRSGPGTDYAKVGELAHGDTVVILHEIDGWYQIEFDGGEGYVSARYVEVS